MKMKDMFLQSSSYQLAFHEEKAQFPEVEEKLSSYLNKRQQFGYVLSH
jgi:hypothetical protein